MISETKLYLGGQKIQEYKKILLVDCFTFFYTDLLYSKHIFHILEFSDLPGTFLLLKSPLLICLSSFEFWVLRKVSLKVRRAILAL